MLLAAEGPSPGVRAAPIPGLVSELRAGSPLVDLLAVLVLRTLLADRPLLVGWCPLTTPSLAFALRPSAGLRTAPGPGLLAAPLLVLEALLGPFLQGPPLLPLLLGRLLPGGLLVGPSFLCKLVLSRLLAPSLLAPRRLFSPTTGGLFPLALLRSRLRLAVPVATPSRRRLLRRRRLPGEFFLPFRLDPPFEVLLAPRFVALLALLAPVGARLLGPLGVPALPVSIGRLLGLSILPLPVAVLSVLPPSSGLVPVVAIRLRVRVLVWVLAHGEIEWKRPRQAGRADSGKSGAIVSPGR